MDVRDATTGRPCLKPTPQSETRYMRRLRDRLPSTLPALAFRTWEQPSCESPRGIAMPFAALFRLAFVRGRDGTDPPGERHPLRAGPATVSRRVEPVPSQTDCSS